MRLFALLVTSTLLLTACGLSIGESPQAENSAVDEAVSEAVEAKAASVEESDGVELVDAGFGQHDRFVRGMAVVTTDDDEAVGKFVTVSMNFLDESDAIVGTSEQVESFSWVGQELVLPVWLSIDVPSGATVAKVETHVSLSDHGLRTGETVPLATVESREVRVDPMEGNVADFEINNPQEADLKDLRIGIVCYDAGGTIIGGGSDYPNLIAAGQTILLESRVMTSGDPAKCGAFPNYG